MPANSMQINSVLSEAVSDNVRQIPMLFAPRSYLHLFEKGSQLYRIVEALESGRQSTLQLHEACGSMAVSTKVSQVRARGVPIVRTEERRGNRVIHFYEIVR